MSAGDEILTPVTKPEAVSMAEIHAMRGLTDAVSALGRQVERMNAKVDDVRERVIKLEAREYERQIEALNERLSAAFKRIDDLEGTRDQQKCAKALVDWLRQTAPVAAGWRRCLRGRDRHQEWSRVMSRKPPRGCPPITTLALAPLLFPPAPFLFKELLTSSLK